MRETVIIRGTFTGPVNDKEYKIYYVRVTLNKYTRLENRWDGNSKNWGGFTNRGNIGACADTEKEGGNMRKLAVAPYSKMATKHPGGDFKISE